MRGTGRIVVLLLGAALGTATAAMAQNALIPVNDANSLTISKAFGAGSIPLNGTTSLTFTITNSTSSSTPSTAFSDTLPAGLVVATPNGLTGSCGGGTITATAGSNVISLSGATLASGTSCTFAVNVTSTTAGVKDNTTSTVTSTESSPGGPASASLTVTSGIPTLSAWGWILMVGVLVAIAVRRMRRQRYAPSKGVAPHIS